MVQQRDGDRVGGGQMNMIWAKQDESVVDGCGMNLVVMVILEATELWCNGWICCGKNEARLGPLGAI